MRVFSYGGGVQSNAAVVLAATGRLDVDAFLFCNVGEDSENPDTLAYVHDVAMPYAADHGIALHELRQRRPSDGQYETVYGRTMSGRRGLVIPVHLAGSGPMRRQCTQDFKVAVVNRWLRQHGATPKHPATVMLGISLDEYQRMSTSGSVRYVERSYPLIDMRLTRSACQDIITAEGLPLCPKSSCWFCPFHTLATWREMHDHRPELFGKAVGMERHLTDWSAQRGHRAVYLSGRQRPLPVLIGEQVQPSLFDEGACESGYCMV